jgi:hypothetical protein
MGAWQWAGELTQMLMQQQNEAIATSNLGAGNTFSIAASAKAFEVLSSNLYQNKILAVIREISCNALDAHKMVGKDASSIEVHFPTFVQQYFSVRDYGPGLSKENVLDLYTTYFKSTKDAANDMIGGFGLGSKSPFAVADQFTVTSWHGGRVSTYVCYKQNGIPQVNVVSEADTNAPAGLEVRVVARDYPVWHSEGGHFFSWWLQVPKHNLAQAPVPMLAADNILLKSEKDVAGYPAWAFTAKMKSNSSSRVVMGMVPYSLALSAIPNLPPEIVAFFAAAPVLLSFNIGELSISPSREALSYDPPTCAALTARLVEIFKTATAVMQKELAAQPTMRDAREFVFSDAGSNELMHRLQALTKGTAKPLWRGQVVHVSEVIKAAEFTPVQLSITEFSLRSHNKTWQRRNNEFEIADNAHYRRYDNHQYWYATNITAKMYRQLQEYGALIRSQNPGTTQTYIILSGPPKADVLKVMEARGFPLLKDVADLPEPQKVAATPRGNSPKTTGYVFNKGPAQFTRTETTLDLTGGGLYVEFYDGEAVDITGLQRLKSFIATELVKNDLPVFGFRQSQLKSKTFCKALEDNGVVLADEAWVKSMLKEDFLADAAWRTAMSESLTGYHPHSHVGALEVAQVLSKAKQKGNLVQVQMPQALQDGLLRFIGSPYNYRYADFGSTTFELVLTPGQKAAADKGRQEASEVLRQWRDFLVVNPLLKFLNWGGNVDRVSLEMLAAYINR